MSAVQPTDKTLVNRAGIDHSAPADMSTVKDTDLLLINRAGVDYKCTFADWKSSQAKPPSVGAVTLADVAGGARFTSTAFPVSATMTDDGAPTSTKKLKAYVEGNLTVNLQSDKITNVLKTSNPPTVGGSAYGSTSASSVFDRDLTNFVRFATPDYGNFFFECTFASPIPVTKEIKIMIRDEPRAPFFDFTINDNAATTTASPGNGVKGYLTVNLAGETSLTKLRAVSARGSKNGCNIFFVEIDGSVIYADEAQFTLTFASDKNLSALVGAQSLDGRGNTYHGFEHPSSNVLKVLGAVDPVVNEVLTATRLVNNVKLYCKLDAAGAVSDLQSADPGFTAWTPAGTGPYTGTVTFPALLPTGAAPDTDLPAGTSITVEVEASNTSGSDSAKSPTITPA